MIKCCFCNQEMALDDRDEHFKGCIDKWYVCEKCNITAIAKIRFGELNSFAYYDENGEWLSPIKIKRRKNEIQI